MLSSMKLSIISITFNNYEELVSTICSIPDRNEIEIVVINGGRCKKTIDFLNSRKDIVSVSEPDEGISDAFNKGFKKARGDLYLFLNSGDEVINEAYLDWLITRNEGDFFYSGIIFDDYEYGKIKIYPHRKNIGYGMPYPHQTLAVRSYVVDRIGYFDKNYSVAMDYDFVCRMHKAGFKGIEYNGEPCILMDGAGVSRKKELLTLNEAYRALKNSGYLYHPPIFITFIVRILRVFSRKGLEKLGLKSIVKKYKMNKAKVRSQNL